MNPTPSSSRAFIANLLQFLYVSSHYWQDSCEHNVFFSFPTNCCFSNVFSTRSVVTYRKHQDWFDQELQTLMGRRDQVHERVLQTRSTRSTTAAYKDACRLLQKRTRALKSERWERKAMEGNRSTMDMIFCLRQLQEKCIEQDRPLLFVDINKAFDTIGRTGPCQLLRKHGCPEKFTTMIEALHTGMIANVSVGGEFSESFGVTNGVKQGCVLDPMVFSILLSAMLNEAFRDMGDGIYIQYSSDNALTYSTSQTSERRPRLFGF